MSLLKVTRESFMERYDKAKTRTNIRYTFVAWDHFLTDNNINEADLFLRMRDGKEDPYRILDAVVQYWKVPHEYCGKKGATTIQNYFNFLKAWVKYNGIRLDNDDIRSHIKFPKPVRERVRGIDKAMIRNTIQLCNAFYRGLWYVLAYTGMRIDSECLNMKWSWIDFRTSPLMIIIPGQHTKTSQERMTFAGGEAEKWLRQRYESLKPQQTDFVFVNPRTGRKLTYGAAYTYFARRRGNLELVERGANGRYHYHPHKYRAYTENKLAKGADSEFAHSILGHTKDLISYNQGGATEQDALNDYTRSCCLLISFIAEFCSLSFWFSSFSFSSSDIMSCGNALV